MKASVLFEGFLSAASNNVAWMCAVLILLFALYLLAREGVAYGWLSGWVSDAALGLCQWCVLLSASTMAVVLAVVYLAVSVIEAYWAYYYPWSVFMT
jgi:hypothetical protein